MCELTYFHGWYYQQIICNGLTMTSQHRRQKWQHIVQGTWLQWVKKECPWDGELFCVAQTLLTSEQGLGDVLASHAFVILIEVLPNSVHASATSWNSFQDKSGTSGLLKIYNPRNCRLQFILHILSLCEIWQCCCLSCIGY